MEKLHIRHESELGDIAKKALEHLKNNAQEKHASVLALHGELGAGKTTFVKILAKMLGVVEEVQSPTFVIMKRYEIEEAAQKASPFVQLYHLDAYRIETNDEMRVIHFDKILEEPNTLVCIEWAERVKELLPEHTLHLKLDIEGEEGRVATFS